MNEPIPTSAAVDDFVRSLNVGFHGHRSKAWDRDAELRLASRFSRPDDQVIAAMWVHHYHLEIVSNQVATLKSDFERMVGRVTLEFRAGIKGENGDWIRPPEKSADVAKMAALQNDDVYVALVQYRLAEQMVTAAREALRVCHARLDSLRTQAADDRAAGAWETRKT